MFYAKLFLCAVLVVVGMDITVAQSYAPRQDPEEPWHGDPNLSKVTDERILRLWEDIVVGFRRETGSGGAIGLPFNKKYMSQRLSDEDKAYLLASLDEELHKESKNWEYIYTLLLLVVVDIDQTSTIPELAKVLFTLPRPMKMSFAHGMSYKTMIALLRHQHSEESAAILYAAAHESFWGDGPLYSPWLSTTSRDEALHRLRQWAVSSLGDMPPNINLVWLEELSEDYPFEGVDERRVALMYAGVMDTDLTIGRMVESRLKIIKEQMEHLECEPGADDPE